MESSESTGTRFARVMLLFALVVYGFGFWVNRARAFTDFRVLHLGGRLVNEGRADVAYDSVAFAEEQALDPLLAETAGELDVFISAPPFALAIRPLSLLESQLALGVFMALGVFALIAAVKLLRLPWWSTIVALVMPFGIAQIYHAQTGFLAIVWAAAIHRLAVDDRRIAAGAVAGLAVLKPTLLLGVAIWWLLDWRRWNRALGSAFAVGTSIAAVTLIDGFEQWRLFLTALSGYGVDEQTIAFNQPTLIELVSRVAGTNVGTHPLTLLVVLALGGAAMRAAIRRWSGDTAALSGLAMIVSVLVSPHLLIYDTGLLLISAAVLVNRNVDLRSIERITHIYVWTSLITIMSIGWLETLNSRTMPATIGLLAITMLWVRTVDSSIRSQPGHGDVSTLHPPASSNGALAA